MTPPRDPLRDQLAASLGAAYTIEHELGGGGMSRVFLATEVALARRVVLKTLPAELAGSVSLERFRREVLVTAKLQHPCLVPVLAAGDADGVPYYVMPFVEGASLRAHLERTGSLPVPDALKVLRDVASALAYAHGRGVVHRDLKPDNVLLSGGYAMVADFGIAKAVSAATHGGTLTSAGFALGTPAYMAPEQALGAGDVDHRADLYALGVIAYELLAGVHPFAARTPQQVVAAHLSETPTPLASRRADLPPGLGSLVTRLLAKDPAERPASAADVLGALEAIGTTDSVVGALASTRPRRPRPRWALGGAVASALAAVGVVFLVNRDRPPPSLDGNLVAVAPFEVLDPNLRIWGEGLMDVLSRSLDGAGSLRTVSPTVVVKRWAGRADAASASALGRATGARLVLYGSLVSAGDSVRASATLIDAAGNRPIGEVDLREQASRMDRLGDSLAVGLLRTLAETRPVGAVRLAGLRASSLPALKAFLQGEQFYRRAAWDSAVAYHKRALGLDSALALSYRRIGMARGWSEEFCCDSLTRDYLLRASAFRRGLSPRDSLLVTADSLTVMADRRFPPLTNPEFVDAVQQLLATLGEGVRRYPDDPEMWHQLGDARAHYGVYLRSTDREVQDAFDRAIALDSALASAYLHNFEIALNLHDAAGARRYARGYLALGPSNAYATRLRIIDAMLSAANGPQSIDVGRMLDTLPANVLAQLALDLRRWPDSAETAVRIYRKRLSGSSGPRGASAGEAARPGAIIALMYRGHVREAYNMVRNPQATIFPYSEMALLGIVPRDSARAAFLPWERRVEIATVQPELWWTAVGDTATLRFLAERADSASRMTKHPYLIGSYRYWSVGLQAFHALARRDTTEALRLLTSVPDSLCPLCVSERFTKAILLSNRRRDREAAALLWEELYPKPGWFPTLLEVWWKLERARVAERLGDRGRAIAAYGEVMDIWRSADPELQVFVAESRQALSRLTNTDTPARTGVGGRSSQ